LLCRHVIIHFPLTVYKNFWTLAERAVLVLCLTHPLARSPH